MTPVQLTTNFKLTEFISRSVWNQWGNNATWFLVKDHVNSMQWLRTRIGVRLVANNWDQRVPGPHFWRGLRTPDAPSFKPWSQHSYKMNATDFDSPDMSVKELYDWIIANQDEIIAKTSIRAIESLAITNASGNGWIHADSRWIPNAKGLLIVNP